MVNKKTKLRSGIEPPGETVAFAHRCLGRAPISLPFDKPAAPFSPNSDFGFRISFGFQFSALLLLFLLGCLARPADICAQYRIDPVIVAAGGGGKSAAGVFELHDAIGQPSGGTASSTNYKVADGFYQTISFPPVRIKTPYLDNNANPTHSIRVDDLLASCLDPEDGLLVLDSVESHSTSGTTITWDQDSVYYAFSDGQSGPDWIKFTVQNEQGDRAGFAVLVVNLPTLTSQPDHYIEPNQNLHITNIVNPPSSGKLLDYTLITAPSGMIVDPDSGAIIWTPTFNQGGTSNRVVVKAASRDTPPLIDYFSFTVVVSRRPIPGGDITWAGGEVFDWRFDNAVGIAGTNWDLLNLTGILNITASLEHRFTIRLISQQADFYPGPAGNFDEQSGYSWTIANASGGIQGFNASAFTFDLSQFQNDRGGGSFSVVLQDRSVVLVFTPVATPCGSPTSATVRQVGQTAEMIFINASGLASAQALTMDNCTIQGIAYDSGNGSLGGVGPLSLTTRTPLPANTVKVLLTATKVMAGEPAAVNVLVLDTCGRGKSFDPVITTLEVTSGNLAQQRFEGLPAAEPYLQVLNGTPGLKWLEVQCNGRRFRLDPLADGQDVAADLTGAMLAGDNNVVVLTGFGEVGASAWVMLSDSSSGSPIELTEVVKLSLGRGAHSLVLAWPGAPGGWQLQASPAVGAGWTNVSAEPVAVNGQWTLDVPASGGARFFRLRGPAAPAGPALSRGAVQALSPTTQAYETQTSDGIAW